MNYFIVIEAMKYLVVISSLIVAGLTVAANVVDGENTHGVKTLDGLATPSLSHVATPGFIMAKQAKNDSVIEAKVTANSSSSHIALPVFTDNDDKPTKQSTRGMVGPSIRVVVLLLLPSSPQKVLMRQFHAHKMVASHLIAITAAANGAASEPSGPFGPGPEYVIFLDAYKETPDLGPAHRILLPQSLQIKTTNRLSNPKRVRPSVRVVVLLLLPSSPQMLEKRFHCSYFLVLI